MLGFECKWKIKTKEQTTTTTKLHPKHLENRSWPCSTLIWSAFRWLAIYRGCHEITSSPTVQPRSPIFSKVWRKKAQKPDNQCVRFLFYSSNWEGKTETEGCVCPLPHSRSTECCIFPCVVKHTAWHEARHSCGAQTAPAGCLSPRWSRTTAAHQSPATKLPMTVPGAGPSHPSCTTPGWITHSSFYKQRHSCPAHYTTA